MGNMFASKLHQKQDHCIIITRNSFQLFSLQLAMLITNLHGWMDVGDYGMYIKVLYVTKWTGLLYYNYKT